MNSQGGRSERILSIDRMKGLAIFCMVFFIAAGEFPCLGFLSRVSNDGSDPITLVPGITVADMECPVFLFLISLTYQLSFDRRAERDGRKKAYEHFLLRYLIFMGLGSIMVSVEKVFIKHVADPFILQSVLMFEFLGALLLRGVFLLIGKKSGNAGVKKAADIAKIALLAGLLALAAIDLVLMVRDDVLLFRGIRNDNEIYMHWSILHLIGLTGLLAIPFLRLNLKQKIVTWFVIAAAYTGVQLIPGMVDTFGYIFLGGSLGCIGYSLILLGGMILTGFSAQKNAELRLVISAIFVILMAYLSCRFLEIRVRAVTMNYLLISLLFSTALFVIVNAFNRVNIRYDCLSWWGRTPLLMFLCALLLKVPLLLWDPAPETPLWLALAVILGGLAVLSTVAWAAYKKEIIVKL